MQGYYQHPEYQHSGTATPISSLEKEDDRDHAGDQQPVRPIQKRQVSSNACEPCRKRKSKCDNARPTCRSCSELHDTTCHYDLDNDLRRKGGLRKALAILNAEHTSYRLVVEAIARVPWPQVEGIVQMIRNQPFTGNEDLAGVVAAIASGLLPISEQPEDSFSGTIMEEEDATSLRIVPENDLILDAGYGELVGMPLNTMAVMPSSLESVSVDMMCIPTSNMATTPSNMEPANLDMIRMPPSHMAAMPSNVGPSSVDMMAAPVMGMVESPSSVMFPELPNHLNQQGNAAAWQQGTPGNQTGHYPVGGAFTVEMPQGQAGYYYPGNTGYYPPYHPQS